MKNHFNQHCIIDRTRYDLRNNTNAYPNFSNNIYYPYQFEQKNELF
jgi:hypothetical protein